MNHIISVSNLCVQTEHYHILKNITFTVEKGDFIGLVGPNGSGKTTLIKTILGLKTISQGVVLIFNSPLKKFTNWEKIGYLPQQSVRHSIMFPATVYEIISTSLRNYNFVQKKKLINEIIEKLNIAELKNRMIGKLSGGQQQRVYLARALVSHPSLLILDEPSTALDPKARIDFFRLLQEINKKNKTTIILVTHDTGYIGKYANKLLYLDKSIIYYGDISGYCPPDKRGYTFEKEDKHIIWHQHE